MGNVTETTNDLDYIYHKGVPMQLSQRKKHKTIKRDERNNVTIGFTAKNATRCRNTVSKAQHKKNIRRKMAMKSRRINRSKK